MVSRLLLADDGMCRDPLGEAEWARQAVGCLLRLRLNITCHRQIVVLSHLVVVGIHPVHRSLPVASSSTNVSFCGVEKDLASFDGCTALMWAAAEGHYPCVNGLVQKEAKIDLVTKTGKNALMLAAQFGREDICKFLATRGAKVDHQDEEGKTALFAAIFAGKDVDKLSGPLGTIAHGSQYVGQSLVDTLQFMAATRSQGSWTTAKPRWKMVATSHGHLAAVVPMFIWRTSTRVKTLSTFKLNLLLFGFADLSRVEASEIVSV